MKLKDDFITRNMGDKQIMVSAGGEFTGMVRSNKSAAFIGSKPIKPPAMQGCSQKALASSKNLL